MTPPSRSRPPVRPGWPAQQVERRFRCRQLRKQFGEQRRGGRPASGARSSARRCRLSRRLDRSRGRALNSAMRPAMRSMSAKPRSACRTLAASAAVVEQRRSPRGAPRAWPGRARDDAGRGAKARAHRGDAGVEQAAQGWRRLAAQGFGEFQVAPGRRVEAEEGRVALDNQRLHMRQGARLRRLRVTQQRAGGGDGRPQTVGAKAGQRGGAEMRTSRGRRPRRRNASPADASAPLPG
jgi:hypothetical protein